MSKRIQLNQTPETNPDLFDRIPSSEVRPGDIFQGSRNPRKWYENEDPSTVDSWRTYYRRKGMTAGGPSQPTSAPSEAAGAGEATSLGLKGGTASDHITVTLQIPVADLKKYFKIKEDPFGRDDD